MDETTLTKKERIELKRKMKEDRRTQDERAKKMKNYLVIGVIIAAVVGGYLWLSQTQDGTGSVDPAGAKNSRWMRGPDNARVVLLEFADFQCPACAAYHPLVKQLSAEFAQDLTVAFRHFPLTHIHKNALVASVAAEAAGQQGKFWEMHDILYENQSEWDNVVGPNEIFEKYAQELGLDTERFKADLGDGALKDVIEQDRLLGLSLGVQGTPSFYVNGQKIQNPGSLEEFKQAITSALANSPITQAPDMSVHEHADLKVYVNGRALDLSQAKYQSTQEKELDSDLHLHSNNGEVIHKHTRGTTLAQFFQSLGMDLTAECLVLDGGERLCSDATKKLKLYVNGTLNPALGEYEFADLDRILVSYGSENEGLIAQQISAVSDVACIYSETCPERGAPPDEECVGGLGTDCE